MQPLPGAVEEHSIRPGLGSLFAVVAIVEAHFWGLCLIILSILSIVGGLSFFGVGTPAW